MAAVAQLALPDHFMRRFFLASVCVDMHHNAEALQHLQARARRQHSIQKRLKWTLCKKPVACELLHALLLALLTMAASARLGSCPLHQLTPHYARLRLCAHLTWSGLHACARTRTPHGL